MIKTTDGYQTLFSSEYRQSYHSKHGARSECVHIYLQASGVARRLQNGLSTTVLEVGFGTGLNFLVTSAMARKTGTPLRYVGLEKNWLPSNVFEELDYAAHLPEIQDICQAISLAKLPSVSENELNFHFTPAIELTVIFSDATKMKIPSLGYDAVYHDAFSPDANPELWTPDFFHKIRKTCESGAVLSTYSSKITVQQALREAGFVVEKVPGPWGKRDILRARAE
ncbi:MAG: hypothetical protein DWQ10_10775 [Calditrichaeota bacterium]|nr:MAG: hypothetical protein DWQ10_10775 [Calditrichota bacterium]